jgi:hypothetical protein
MNLDFLEPWLGWETVEDTDIDFNSMEPVRTSNSLHIYSEEYEVDGYIYRLYYEISNTDEDEIM